jgi:Rhs element Vgr protein
MPQPAATNASSTAAVLSCRITLGDPARELDKTVHILSVSVCRAVNRIPFARIRLSDGDVTTGTFALADSETLVPGTRIGIALGYGSDEATVFTGVVTSVSERISSRSSEMIVEARDEAVKMTLVPGNRHFTDLTDGDLATQLIESHGLTADVQTTDVHYQNMVQYNTSDWDFLVSRMDRQGRIVLARDGTVSARQPDLRAKAVADVRFGENLLEFNACVDARTQISALSVSAWNPGAQEMETTDTDYNEDTAGNLSPGELTDALKTPAMDIRSTAPLGQQERQHLADARKMKNVLGKIRGRVKFFGDGNVHAGDVITLKGVGARFSGPAFVGAVTHEYAAGGWTTEATLGMAPEWFAQKAAAVSAGPPGLAAAPGSATTTGATGLLSMIRGLQIGVVTDIVDPDDEFRVKVRLVGVSADQQGVWARVATLDAGNARGTFFRPETGDEVIVGFIQDDPSFPVILGMMHSSALASPIAPASENDEKGYQSREGLKLTFNDGLKSVTLETPSGKSLVLDEDQGVIRIQDENNNTMRFDGNGITITSGSDLTIQASGTLSLSGASVSMKANSDMDLSAVSVSVSGSGTTEIKGAIVKIN